MKLRKEFDLKKPYSVCGKCGAYTHKEFVGNLHYLFCQNCGKVVK